MSWISLLRVPIEGSSLFGFFQLKVMVLPVIDSITGVPSGGSGRISENGNNHCQMSKQVEQLYQVVSAALKWQGHCKWTQDDNHCHSLSSHTVHHFSFLYTVSYYRSLFTHIPNLVTKTVLYGTICSSLWASEANSQTKEAEFGAQHAERCNHSYCSHSAITTAFF